MKAKMTKEELNTAKTWLKRHMNEDRAAGKTEEFHKGLDIWDKLYALYKASDKK